MRPSEYEHSWPIRKINAKQYARVRATVQDEVTSQLYYLCLDRRKTVENQQ